MCVDVSAATPYAFMVSTEKTSFVLCCATNSEGLGFIYLFHFVPRFLSLITRARLFSSARNSVTIGAN
jgi:hypothetical protein